MKHPAKKQPTPAALKANAARVKAGQKPVAGPKGAKPTPTTKTALDQPGGEYNEDVNFPD